METVTANLSKFMEERDKKKEADIRAYYMAQMPTPQSGNIGQVDYVNDLNFKAWYEKTDYEKLLEIQETGTVDTYQLWFGEDGEDGVWEWEGVLSISNWNHAD